MIDPKNKKIKKYFSFFLSLFHFFYGPNMNMCPVVVIFFFGMQTLRRRRRCRYYIVLYFCCGSRRALVI